MSLVISSTTDDQAAVNAAAGITEEAPESTQQPPEAARPPKPPEPIETPDEEEEDEEGEEQETEEGEPQPVKKKLGGWQRKIQKLEEANQYAYRKLAQLEDSLKPKQEAQGPPPRPKLEDYPDNYDAYIEALADWKTDRKLELKEQENLKKAREWQAQEAERAVAETWQTRMQAFRSKVKDFDEALDSSADIELHPAIRQSIAIYENGPRLAYELARNRPELEKIAAYSNPLDAIRELGRFEASLTAGAPPRIETRKPFTAPPEPIRPVGKGSNGNVRVPLDQLDYQDFKRARNADIKARRG